MTKSEVIKELQLLVHERLFGPYPWRSDRETIDALKRRLEQLGLEARVPGDPASWQATPLGVELHLDLMTVFMGLLVTYEMPMVLAEHDLIDGTTAENLQDRLYDPRYDSDPVLLPLVRECYCRYFSRSGLLN